MASQAAAGAQGIVRFARTKPVEIVPPVCLWAYRWVADAGAPRMLAEAIALCKLLDASPSLTIAATIPAWEVECHGKNCVATSLDPVPHAGIVMAVLARRARKTVPEAPHCALNWANFGSEAGQPRLGDVLCVMRDAGGYVGLYVGEDDAAYHVLGADVGDRITVTRFPKERLYAARRPVYEGKRPAAHGIRLNRDGSLAG